MRTIAFLGAGNMASAMVSGLLAGGAAKPADLRCAGGGGATAAALARRTGIHHSDSIEGLLEGAGTLVVAFKPQHLGKADPRLAELTRGLLVISVLAGKKLDRLSSVFPGARNIVRSMPNTPGQIGAGVTGWCALREPSTEDREVIQLVLGSLGLLVELPEERMDALTALSGSGPAYVFEFAAALRDAGVSAGLDPDMARILSVETLLGAARLLAKSGSDPETLRNQVTSPNGTTFAGLQRMKAAHFRDMIRDTVQAAKARAEEMALEP